MQTQPSHSRQPSRANLQRRGHRLGTSCLSVFLLFVGPALANSDPESSATFFGLITQDTVDQFIAEYPPGSIGKLVITSPDGDADAGMRFGQWVKQNNLDVQVRTFCKSACANFVFPAGRKKIIEPGSMVLWRGSSEQKNIREFTEKYTRLLIKKASDSISLSQEENDFLTQTKQGFVAYAENREAQARFFDSIQVNEYITRLGQEPINYGVDSWTTTVRVMEKFGITNVEAPPDYGKPSDKTRLMALMFNHGKSLTFDLDEYGQVHRIE